MVIEEYLQGNCTMQSLLHKYEIGGNSALLNWMRRLNYLEPGVPSGGNFVSLTPAIVSKKVESKNVADLQGRIRELERQLEDEKLRSEAYCRIIDRAEKELKIPIRKKPNTK